MLLALLALVCLGSDPALRAGAQAAQEELVPPKSLVFYVGARVLDDDRFYEPAEDLGVLGFEIDWNLTREPTAGLGLELGLFLAADTDDDSGADVLTAFVETSVGLRGRVSTGPVEFFAGAGPTLLLAAIDIDNGPEEDDESFGLYAHAGALFHFNDTFGMGFDVRGVTGSDIEFGSGSADTDGDYTQAALIFGWTP